MFFFFLWKINATRRSKMRVHEHRWPNYTLGQCIHSSRSDIVDEDPSFAVLLLIVLRISFVITYFMGWRQLRCRGNNVMVFIIFSIVVVMFQVWGLIQITGASAIGEYSSIAITRQYFYRDFYKNFLWSIIKYIYNFTMIRTNIFFSWEYPIMSTISSTFILVRSLIFYLK